MAYQGRKKARTSNSVHLTNQKGVPLYLGDVYSGNHNDLFDIIPQFQRLVAWCKATGINLKGIRLNMDKGFDCKKLRRFCFRHGLIPNVKENPRNRKRPKPGPKRLFDEEAYKNRFVCERTWAWFDSFRTLLVRFETSVVNWKSWHYLAAFMMVAKV